MRVLTVIALLSGGCLVAAGPTVGIVVPHGRPTIGWEASGSLISFGQSFAADRWRHRTYFLFEPRLGRTFGSSRDYFAGGGLSLGWRLDTTSERAGPREWVWTGGGFAGGGRLIDGSDDPAPYLSISLGIREDEIYLAPKVGFFSAPDAGFSLSVR